MQRVDMSRVVRRAHGVRRLSVVATLAMTAALIAFGCAPASVEQRISGPTQVGPRWMEFVPSKPLRAVKSQQEVFLGLDGVVDWDLRESKIVLADGSRGRVDAWVDDDRGERYDLTVGGIGGRGGVYLARKSVVYPAEEQLMTGPAFPSDRLYVRVGIRSDLTLDLREIPWVTHSNT